mmetsp:Transcript_12443/g.17270  ORF Transcript_12443/g.17270 Transcript_12443/m.17270 type:complete len:90 (+) Transcript_12443:120-389(+)
MRDPETIDEVIVLPSCIRATGGLRDNASLRHNSKKIDVLVQRVFVISQFNLLPSIFGKEHIIPNLYFHRKFGSIWSATTRTNSYHSTLV